MTLPRGSDVVIVGSGMAGLAVADGLRRRRPDVSVLVLESGPDCGRTHVRSALCEEDALHLWLSPDSDPCFWRPYETDGPHYLGLSGLRRRVGGRSLYWGGALLPIEPWALQDRRWPASVVSDLVEGWDGGASLYSRVADEVSAWATPATVPNPPADALTIGSRRFQPTPQAVRRHGEGRWAAFTPLDRLAEPNAGSSVVICPDCHVLGVTVGSGKVSGVRVHHADGLSDVRAGAIVLAAGTIENSRLAIQALADAGDLPDLRLGGLVDKIAHGFSVACPADELPPDVRRAAAAGGTFHLTLDASLRSNHFVHLSTTPTGMVAMDTWLMGEQVPGEAGEVRCDRSAQWPWPARVNARLGPADELLCEAQRAALGQFWREIAELFGMARDALVFDEAFGSTDLPSRLLAARAATDRIGPVSYSFPLGSEQHEAGTTPLGTLLDDRHEFRSLRGLTAAGPSAFPRTGAANPAMTILALGKRLAGELASA